MASFDKGKYILGTNACDVSTGESRIMCHMPVGCYCITDKELLAVRYFVEYFCQYLLGRKVQTDHPAIKWIFSLKEPKSRILK